MEYGSLAVFHIWEILVLGSEQLPNDLQRVSLDILFESMFLVMINLLGEIQVCFVPMCLAVC